jgi:type II secretory ATPase GspE/PulE/Tfp pilus assembly ATPase PilB-like protein
MSQQMVMTSLGGLSLLAASGPIDVVEVVDLILEEAISVDASDVHLLPTAEGMEMR